MKKITSIFFLLIFQSFILIVYSQQPTQEWVQRLSWNNYASGLSVKLDSNGNVYVLMKLVSDSTSGDFGLAKYSPGGSLIWNVNYNSPGNLTDAPKAFSVTPVGDIYITGYSYLNTSPDKITTVKYNSNGVLQWARVYSAGGPGDGPSSIVVDKAGNIIVAGGMAISNTLQYSLIIKYNSNGDSLWTKEFTQLPFSFNAAVVLDESNNIYTVGGYGSGNVVDYLMLKYDPNGILQWYTTYDSPQHYTDNGCLIDIDSSRNTYIVGTTYVPGSALNNTLLKISSGGIIQWSRIFSGIISGQGNCEIPGGLVLSQDGNSIFYTTECANVQGNGEVVTLKYNPQGDSLWVRRYAQGLTGGVPTNGPALKLDKYNNIYIAGSAVFPSTGSDFLTIKYLSNGEQQWVATYNGPLSNSIDYGHDLAIDTSLNVYITGMSSRYNGNPILWEAATIKYSQPSGVEQISSNMPGQFKLGSNYPNPFNPNTKFKFEIPKLETVKIVIYDIIGRELAVLVNDKLKPGIYEANWNAGNYSSGVYFYTLIAETYKETKKAILIK
jgi:hypothetical protein